MNYYERHLGDYARDAGHLTMLEHGAYTLLLDRYYTTEQGIPADQAHRICRARTRDERAAVDAVLQEFFTLTDGVHHQKRVDAEIVRYRESEPDREAKRENERERQRRARERRRELFDLLRQHGIVPAYDAPMSELQTLASRVKSQPVTQPVTRDDTATQTPDTRHQIPNTNTQHPATSTGGGAGDSDSPPEPSMAGIVCGQLRRLGIADTNPGHPSLLALLEAGAQPSEFAAFADKAKGKSSPFAYLLRAVASERENAAQMAGKLHQGAMPQRALTPAEQRVLQAVPGLAAPHLRPAAAALPAELAEVIDVTPRRIG